MKACVIQELSGPSGLVYTDVDDVRGGNDTMVIDVRAAGVCFPDLPPPFIPGMEAAGVVRSAPEESEFKVGERVSAFGVLGGYAEQLVAPVDETSAGSRRHGYGISISNRSKRRSAGFRE